MKPQSTFTPEQAYRERVESGQVKQDAAQVKVLEALQALYARLQERSLRKRHLSLRAKTKEPPQSLYIWGSVGRGKSMLMDLFFETAPLARKKRVHFHRFMQDIHAGLHRLREQGRKNPTLGDPVMRLIEEIAESTELLCFDELQATDVADASLIFRLFEGLLDAGVVMVSTSNHPPASLYTGGVQKERFAKLTQLLQARMRVLEIASPSDYRMKAEKSLTQTYFSPLGAEANIFITQTLRVLEPEGMPRRVHLKVQGRQVPLTYYGTHIACASFHELCEMPLGVADYLAITASCTTLVITEIPRLSALKRNEAKRFVTLIDALYEHKTKLICTADAPIEQLYPQGDGSFEFKRTVSRLHEMQSEGYQAHKG